jgi:hypothetical protein
MRLDEAKVDELRRWAQSLQEAAGEESVAAGRAILMLIEELDRSRVELFRTRELLERVAPMSNSEVDAGAGDSVALGLQGRLRRVLGRDSGRREAGADSVEEPYSSVETDSETAAARSWIETLRRPN